MIDLVQLIRGMVEADRRGQFVRAAVTGTSGNLVLVQRQGAAAPDPAGHPRLASYSPTVGDEVLLLRLGGGWLVIGRILR